MGRKKKEEMLEEMKEKIKEDNKAKKATKKEPRGVAAGGLGVSQRISRRSLRPCSNRSSSKRDASDCIRRTSGTSPFRVQPSCCWRNVSCLCALWKPFSSVLP